MKQQGLAEPLKVESDEGSTLRSELAKKENFIEELKKEIEVNICNYVHVYMYVCVHYLRMFHVCTVSTYLYSYFIAINFNLMNT